ncbi:MAG: hypothetical protein KDB14_05560 [Planctomycetales bacterium]|nr:hypothetical protein [Planctomycetales bacterium]
MKKRPGRTAGSDGVNKSAEIRDMLKSRPELKPAVIASLLQQRGVEVTAQYVSMIKSTLKKRSRRSSIASSDKVISLRQLAEVRRLVDKVGGVDQLERILDLIRELQ